MLAELQSLVPFAVVGVSVGAIYALSGMGIVILFRATGELNFSYGATGAASAFISWELMDKDVPVALALFLGIACSILFNWAYGTFVSPRVAHRDVVVKAVATLGFALILLGAMYFVWGDTPRRLNLPFRALNLTLFDVRITGTRTLTFILVFVLAVGVTLLLNRTRLGMLMRALANNRSLSSVIGIDVGKVGAAAWTISGLLAGVSGILLGNLVKMEPGVLTFLVIPAIAAAIVGRMSSLGATLAGGFIIGVLEAVATPFPFISSYRSIAPFVVALLFLLLSPHAAADLSDRKS